MGWPRAGFRPTPRSTAERHAVLSTATADQNICTSARSTPGRRRREQPTGAFFQVSEPRHRSDKRLPMS
jgi:hypothetical protein